MSSGEEEINASTSSDKWTYRTTKMLVTFRLEIEDDFKSGRKRRSTLWSSVLRKMQKETDLMGFTVDDLIRKFNNLLITYRRIKKRNGKTGRGSTKWEFFSVFDDVYGNRHSIDPPITNMISTLGSGDDSFQSFEKPPKKRKKVSDEFLEYLKKQDESEEKKYGEMMKVEMEKNEIERKKVNILEDMKNMLERVFLP